MFLFGDHLSIFIASLVIGIAALFFGIIVFIDDRHNNANRTYFFLSIALAAFVFLDILNEATSNLSSIVFTSRLQYAVAAFICFFVYEFSYYLGGNAVGVKLHHRLTLALSSLFAFLALTPLIHAATTVSADGIVSNRYGIGLYFFLAYFVGVCGAGAHILFAKWRSAEPVLRCQIEYIFVGITLSSIFGVAVGAVLPAIFDYRIRVGAGALACTFFVFLSAYAILRHGLFKMRMLTVTTFAFLLLSAGFAHIFLAENLSEFFLNIGFFALVVISVIFMMRSAILANKQRENLSHLLEKLHKSHRAFNHSDKIRKELLSFVSHQFKQPLVVLKGYSSMIYEGAYGAVSDDLKDGARRILRATNTLVSLTDNFLDMRAIEEGKMRYNFKTADIVPLVRDAVDELSDVAREKKLALTFETNPPIVICSIDPVKFKQAIQNFVDNAVKYTKVGYVAVAIREHDDLITVSIKDSGIGMSEEFIATLFTEFSRDVAMQKSNEFRGTGLGMYISRNILKAHGAAVRAESAGLGKGSCFYIDLPKNCIGVQKRDLES